MLLNFLNKLGNKRSNDVIDLLQKGLIKEPEKRTKTDEVTPNQNRFNIFSTIKKIHLTNV